MVLVLLLLVLPHVTSRPITASLGSGCVLFTSSPASRRGQEGGTPVTFATVTVRATTKFGGVQMARALSGSLTPSGASKPCHSNQKMSLYVLRVLLHNNHLPQFRDTPHPVAARRIDL